ncbi:unnamed protein product [Clonostachys rosea]|uniref:FAD-binding PCMH-type domain-containing protein n=1 Tax=Bionectria ochroleuca TaxID=29856 RepID=A0ABY6U9F4_BIOOC|nr:unnamed protein product [Clonostachys rosea]
MRSLITHFVLLASLAANAHGSALCKNHPSSPHWPTESDWQSLNQSTQGALLAGVAPASSCYDGNPLGSDLDCDTVQENWFLSQFHAEQPASIGYSYWANSSCVAPNDYAYDDQKPCQLGGLPQYVLNATDATQVATAMAWANSRDIRVVIKGTGHDLNGRSSGAYALSIWTHHLQRIEFDPHWIRPAFNSTENVAIAQTGNTWGRLLKAASDVNRTVVSGQDGTVGLGGFIGGGGHGPLSSLYGLSADQILQATIVTTDGSILVANDEQNQDLLWAIRGGGPGSYGLVIEYVMRTFPLPSNVVVGNLSLSTQENGTQEASWDGLTTLMRALPDLTDSGLTGFGIGTVSQSKSSNTSAVGRQVDVSMLFYLFNSTTAEWTSLLSPLQQQMAAFSNNQSVQVTLSEPDILPQYLDLFDVLNPTASSCGDISLSSSRLLGRRELNDISHDTVKDYHKRLTTAQIEGKTARLVIGLQGGKGPRNVEDNMRGGLTPAWRDAYLHVLVTGSSIETEGTNPRSALQAAADWTNAHKETVWAEWAPDSGSYINEANPSNPNFQHDFYGDHYSRLLSIKEKYDPQSILYVQAGVGSQDWDYNLQDGKLCRK